MTYMYNNESAKSAQTESSGQFLLIKISLKAFNISLKKKICYFYLCPQTGMNLDAPCFDVHGSQRAWDSQNWTVSSHTDAGNQTWVHYKGGKHS